MSSLNKLANCHNTYQGGTKRVLCVCSAGLLRSPTMAKVIGEVFGHNTRSAGIVSEYALIDVSDVLIEWAEEIVVAEEWMKEEIEEIYGVSDKVFALNIPDKYPYNHPTLVQMIKDKYEQHSAMVNAS